MYRSACMHSNFFSTLKQVDKRLQLEDPCLTSDPTLPAACSIHTQSKSDTCPVYLLNMDEKTKQPSALDDSGLPHEFLTMSHKFCTTQDDSQSCQKHQETKQPSTLDDSELPREFLTMSHKFSTTQDDSQSPQKHQDLPDVLEEEKDDIELLMQLIHLPNSTEMNDQVVGMEGPKCQREVERLDAWIRHFEKTSETLRLAHLLLAKAASISWDEIEYPSTVEEFLLNDPPTTHLEKI